MASVEFVRVIFPQISNRQFIYRLPTNYQGAVFSGQRVIAPLKQSSAMGFILEPEKQPPTAIEIKPLMEIVDLHPLLPPRAVQLFAPLGRLLPDSFS